MIKVVSVGVVCVIFTSIPQAAAQGTCISPPSSMVAWWAGDRNTDEIVGARNGSLVGSAGFAPSIVADAFSFDGNGWVEVADDPIWTLGTRDFTIDLWVRFNSLSGRDPFIAHDNGSGEQDKWVFLYDEQGHDKQQGIPALRFHINSPHPAPVPFPHDTVVAPWNPLLGRWYHVAVTRSGISYALYIDGVQVATDTSTFAIPDPSAPLTIGTAEADSSIMNLDGLVDEVEILDRALSASEIQAIFNAGSAGKCKTVNALVTFEPMPSTYQFTPDTTGCPAGFVGRFSFDARLTNVSDQLLTLLAAEVTTITGGNVLQNADGGPAGVGARLTVPRQEDFADGVLSAAEFVDVPFAICIRERSPFRFFVNVLGVIGTPATQTQVLLPYLSPGYRFLVVPLGEGVGFEQPDFDDSHFAVSDAAFGTGSSCPLDSTVQTPWPLETDLLLRKTFLLPVNASTVKVAVAIDNDVEVFVNGQDISGGLQVHEGCAERESFVFSVPESLLVFGGENLLAVRARDRGVISYVDVEVRADIPPF
jgi:hypothetical protein